MIPADYAKKFLKDGADVKALNDVIKGIYAEKLTEIKSKGRRMTIQDLEALELTFQAFRRHALVFSDDIPIPPQTLRLVIQKSMPANFDQWNNHHKGKLLDV